MKSYGTYMTMTIREFYRSASDLGLSVREFEAREGWDTAEHVIVRFELDDDTPRWSSPRPVSVCDVIDFAAARESGAFTGELVDFLTK